MDIINILESVRDLMICELDKIGKAQDINSTTLDHVDKIVDIIKDIDEIEANEDMSGYSQRNMDYNYVRGNSYGRGDYRNGRMYTRNYMRNNAGDQFIMHLEQAMSMADNDRDREAIRKLINDMNR